MFSLIFRGIRFVLKLFLKLIAYIFIIVILFVILGALISSYLIKEKDIVIPKNIALSIDFSNQFLEKNDNLNFLEKIKNLEEDKKNITIHELINSIIVAKNDSNVKGLVLNLDFISQSYTDIFEILEALNDFKTSGKFITAYTKTLITEKNLLLATATNEFYASPLTYVDLDGLDIQVTFYKKLLEKLNIDINLIKHGKYKDYGEVFTNEKMSPESRVQYKRLMDVFWDKISKEILSSKEITKEKLDEMINNLEIGTTSDLVKLNIIKNEIYPDDFKKLISTNLDVSIEELKEKKLLVDINEYEKYLQINKAVNLENKIAVLVLNGTIMPENSSSEAIISDIDVRKQLKVILSDKNIKSIVVRVNSPGGDILTSDLVWNEIKKADEQIPVIASMGTLAASGGYYISMGAREIFANPTTITGSIGIFAIIPKGTKLANKYGITFDEVKLHQNSGIERLFEDLNPIKIKYLQKRIDDGYNVFINRVKENRGKDYESIDSVAQGRVWIGEDALNKGLVDKMGSLNDAIERAAEIAEITNYTVEYFPKEKTIMEEIKDIINKDFSVNIKSNNKEIDNLINEVKKLSESKYGLYYLELNQYKIE